MVFTAFLLGVVLTVVLVVALLVWLARRSRDRTISKSVDDVQFAVEDFVEELRQESEEYLENLDKVFSK